MFFFLLVKLPLVEFQHIVLRTQTNQFKNLSSHRVYGNLTVLHDLVSLVNFHAYIASFYFNVTRHVIFTVFIIILST